MFIKNYGLFWRLDEVKWKPGRGADFQLLGLCGKNRRADFRRQTGIYILYGNHGPCYVGLTRGKKMGIGRRLREHLYDKHGGKWDRFSWFGFQEVEKSDGLCKLKAKLKKITGNTDSFIKDIEALLICAMGLDNINQMNFSKAEQWKQEKKKR